MATKELTISISDEILKEIERFKESTHKKSTNDAVAELIKYALTFPPYFKEYDWEIAETEADKEIAAGKIESFNSVEDLLFDLKR